MGMILLKLLGESDGGIGVVKMLAVNGKNHIKVRIFGGIPLRFKIGMGFECHHIHHTSRKLLQSQCEIGFEGIDPIFPFWGIIFEVGSVGHDGDIEVVRHKTRLKSGV